MIVKNVEKKENNTALLQVEVDAESFEKAVNSAYKKLKGSIYVAGFRKGKAPRVVSEGMYGSDIFHDEAVQILAPEAFEYAVEQEKLDTVGVPSIADYNVDDAKALTITFHTELYPVVTLGQYKGLEGVYSVTEVTDEDKEKFYKQLEEDYGENAEKVKGMIDEHLMMQDIERRKAADLIYESAVKTEPKAEEAAEAPAEAPAEENKD